MDKQTFGELIMKNERQLYRILRENARSLPMDEGRSQGVSDDRSSYSELYEALSGLPCELRVVLELYYLEGYAVKEIADIMELPEGTIKSRMSRGREQLRRRLEDAS